MPTQLKKSNGHLDIYRTKKRKKFLYLNSRGGQIKDVNTLKRISCLRIPPAYNEVKISSKISHKLQATGVDDKGRVQYIYDSKHLEKRHKVKFKELINFGSKIEKIRKDMMLKIKDDDSPHSKSKIIALVIYLLDNCLFRIGNKFYTKQYNTYGITTLKPKHFNCKGNIIYIEFVGKKNVVNYCQVKNKYIVPLLKKMIKNAGKNNNVFRYENNRGNFTEISALEVNKFLKVYYNKLSVKMFRTWAANYIFLEETVKDLRRNIDLTQSVTDMYAKKHVIKTLKTIADKLHNTPTVSKKSYMNNEILNVYLGQPVEFYKKIKSGQRKDLNKLLLELLDTAT
jgi:DNA topoisomerase-1